MRRREFIAGLGSAAAWSARAGAQPSPMPVIGFLSSASSDLWASRLRAFRQGLNDIGYVEGQNVAIEYRWAEGKNDRLPAMAADLVRRKVTVITAGNTVAALAAKEATATIPIIFETADPVIFDLVTNFNRPGGNLSGVSNLNLELGPKRLELLHELVSTASIIALLVNPTNPRVAETLSKAFAAAARAFGLQVHFLHASTERDFDTVFASLVQLRAGGLVVGPDALFNTRSERLAALAMHYAVPAIYQYREFAAAGGLMSYGTDITDTYRTVGVYTGRALKGEKPGELPVQQTTKVELIINMKTAKTLGLTFPLTLLGRADEVIE
jgi:putative tryptophan/tyrosine transport system substrate-binding protein